jgi:hypothetical protein
MPKPYWDDLRERVIEAVEAGASQREAAESFNLSPSSAVKWSTSPLEAHAEWLLAMVEIVAAIRLTAKKLDTPSRRKSKLITSPVKIVVAPGLEMLTAVTFQIVEAR